MSVSLAIERVDPGNACRCSRTGPRSRSRSPHRSRSQTGRAAPSPSASPPWKAGSTPAWSSVTVDVRDRDVAGVGDHVGPGDRVADRDQRPGRVVGVGAVGGLLDVDLGADAEVVGGVGGAQPEALRVVAGGGAGVLVLARGRRPGRLEGPGLRGVKEAVGVVVAADEGRADAGLVVVDRDVCDRHVAGVGDHVGPGDRVADRDLGPGADVGVDPVGGLLDVELGAGAEVVGGVGVGDLDPRRAGPGRGAEVLVLAGLRLSARRQVTVWPGAMNRSRGQASATP